MKITQTADRALLLETAEQDANKDCRICPCCGKPHRGFTASRHWYEGGFLKKGRYMKIDLYSCGFCGAKWETDPYEIVYKN